MGTTIWGAAVLNRRLACAWSSCTASRAGMAFSPSQSAQRCRGTPSKPQDFLAGSGSAVASADPAGMRSEGICKLRSVPRWNLTACGKHWQSE